MLKKGCRTGILTAYFLILYGIFRFTIEFFERARFAFRIFFWGHFDTWADSDLTYANIRCSVGFSFLAKKIIKIALMIEYIELLRKVRNSKNKRLDRTGTGTVGIFGYQMRFDLRLGFPLVTTKIHFKSVVHELLWFFRRRY